MVLEDDRISGNWHARCAERNPQESSNARHNFVLGTPDMQVENRAVPSRLDWVAFFSPHMWRKAHRDVERAELMRSPDVGPRRVRRRSLPGTKTHCPSVGFDRQNCVLEPFGGKVFGRDPILKRSHFPDVPVERHIRPELEQQQVAVLHFVSRDLDHFALA